MLVLLFGRFDLAEVVAFFGCLQLGLCFGFCPLGRFGAVAAKGAGRCGNGGGGLGPGSLLGQHGLQVGQLGQLAVGAGRVAVDAQCFYCGGFAADGEVAGAEGGAGGAAVVAAGLLRQAGAVVKAAVAGAVGKGLAQFGVLEGGVVGVLTRAVAAVAAGQCDAAGAVVAVVADVFEAQLIGGELVVFFGRSRSNSAAFEVDAVGVDVVAAVTGKQAALLVYGTEAA